MTDARREHVVAVVVDGQEITGWVEYQITNSIVEPADTFSLTVPASQDSRALWRALRTDRLVKVTVDRIPRITGHIDEPVYQAAAGTITITGRCKIGRLVQESAPSVDYSGLTAFGLIQKLAEPHFKKVTASNARNRRVLRGKGKKARADENKVYLDSRKGTRIEAGQPKWQVIQELLDQMGYLAWSSGDGTELVVGKPDFGQEIQYKLVHPRHEDLARSINREELVKDLQLTYSSADRYSRIVVLGSGAGTAANYGLSVAARAGEYKDGPGEQGEGRDFSVQKVLVIADKGIKDRTTAQVEAEREAARRNMHARIARITMPYHGQLVGGQHRTLYTPDTLAFLDERVTSTKGAWMLVSTTLRASRQEGETTQMEAVPKGTELAA